MNTKEFVAMQMAKGFTERKIPDLRHIHCDENLQVLCGHYDDTTPNGFHDTYIAIIEARS